MNTFSPTPTTYDRQAAAFLERFGLRMTIQPAGDMPPPWHDGSADHGRRYAIEIKGGYVTGDAAETLDGVIRFDFWGSINDRQQGTHPRPYDVLSCISSDIYTPETFAEFCDDYGDDEDSRQALATFERCNEFAERLRAFFDSEASREALAEIQ